MVAIAPSAGAVSPLIMLCTDLNAMRKKQCIDVDKDKRGELGRHLQLVLDASKRKQLQARLQLIDHRSHLFSAAFLLRNDLEKQANRSPQECPRSPDQLVPATEAVSNSFSRALAQNSVDLFFLFSREISAMGARSVLTGRKGTHPDTS